MYSLDKLETEKDFDVNSIIMELASDNADEITNLECGLNNIFCYIEEGDGIIYSEEAQEIFNIHYEKQVDVLYKTINEILKIDKK